MMQFATAKHLWRIWKLIRSMLSASSERLAALEKLFLTNDTGDDLLAITDAAYRILAAIDRTGRARFDVGLTTRESRTEGDHEVRGAMRVRDTRLMESDDCGLYYITDMNGHILFMIDRDGNTNFKGVPDSIKAELEAIRGRLDALEQ